MNIGVSTRGMNTADRLLAEIDLLCEALSNYSTGISVSELKKESRTIYGDNSLNVLERAADLNELRNNAFQIVLDLTELAIVVSRDNITIVNDLRKIL